MRSVDEDSKIVISFLNGSVVLIFYYFPINVCTVNFRFVFFVIRECFCANRFDSEISIALPIFTICNSSCGKIMLSQMSVCPWGEVYTPR